MRGLNLIYVILLYHSTVSFSSHDTVFGITSAHVLSHSIVRREVYWVKMIENFFYCNFCMIAEDGRCDKMIVLTMLLVNG